MNTNDHVNWFAGSRLGQLLASTPGRWLRIVTGLGLMAVGLGVGGAAGIITATIGLVPLLAGVMDVCIFSALFGGPLSGRAIRGLRAR